MSKLMAKLQLTTGAAYTIYQDLNKTQGMCSNRCQERETLWYSGRSASSLMSVCVRASTLLKPASYMHIMPFTQRQHAAITISYRPPNYRTPEERHSKCGQRQDGCAE